MGLRLSMYSVLVLLLGLHAYAFTSEESRSAASNFVLRNNQSSSLCFVKSGGKDAMYKDVSEQDGWIILSDRVFHTWNETHWYDVADLEQIGAIWLSQEVLIDLLLLDDDGIRQIGMLCQKFLMKGGSLFTETTNIRIVQVFSDIMGSEPQRVLLGNSIDGYHFINQQGPKSSSDLQKVIIINLLRREDRKHAFIEHLQETAPTEWQLPTAAAQREAAAPVVGGHAPAAVPVEVVPATEGRRLDLFRPELARLFGLGGGRWAYGGGLGNPHQDHFYSRSVLGCALSHISVWERLVEDDSVGLEDFYLIFEDDARLPPDFAERWAAALRHTPPGGGGGGSGGGGGGGCGGGLAADRAWGAVLLGALDDGWPPPWGPGPGPPPPPGNGGAYQRPGGRRYYGDLPVAGHEGIEQFSSEGRFYSAGAFAYALKKKAAIRLLRRAQTQGVTQPIDWFLFGGFAAWPAYRFWPPLAAHAPRAASPGEIHDQYPQERLLIPKYNDSLGLVFKIASPEEGSVLLDSSPVKVKLQAETTGPAALAAAHHRHLRLCLAVLPLGGSGAAEEVDLGCFDDLFDRQHDIELPKFGPGSWTIKASVFQNPMVAEDSYQDERHQCEDGSSRKNYQSFFPADKNPEFYYTDCFEFIDADGGSSTCLENVGWSKGSQAQTLLIHQHAVSFSLVRGSNGPDNK